MRVLQDIFNRLNKLGAPRGNRHFIHRNSVMRDMDLDKVGIKPFMQQIFDQHINRQFGFKIGIALRFVIFK